MTDPKPPGLLTKVVQYLSYKQSEELNKVNREALRDALSQQVQQDGDVDEKGNVYLELPQPVTVGDKLVRTLKAERKVSLNFNEDKAIELAAERGAPGRLIKTMEYVGQDEVYVLYQEGVFSDEDVDSLFDKHVSWAFKTLAD